MKILNFGSCNIDHVYRVGHIVKPGETILSQSADIFAGGKGLNQSVALAKSGAEVYHAGCIGNDGLFLKNMLDAFGVNTRYIKIDNRSTGHAIIQVDDKGENSIILFNGANYSITKDFVDDVLKDFSENDILVLQNEINNLEYIISKAYEKGFKIVLNPSPINKTVLNIDLNKISLLVVNQIEACAISNKTDIDEICDYFTSNYPSIKLILTLGKKGCIFASNTEKTVCKAYPVTAVDTTGAGDTFLGYFVSYYFKSCDVKVSLELASMAAAIAVTKKGAAESIPFLKDVLAKWN